MAWEFQGELILREGGILVGSIEEAHEGFSVEILWSGHGGDIHHQAATRAEAEAFVKGVEAMLERFGGCS